MRKKAGAIMLSMQLKSSKASFLRSSSSGCLRRPEEIKKQDQENKGARTYVDRGFVCEFTVKSVSNFQVKFQLSKTIFVKNH